jgi:outer membrane protein OmpA-like peptidoglycan-associated protein
MNPDSSQDQLALSPEALRTYNRWHLIGGLILLLLLVALPLLFGIGPTSFRSCGAPAAAAPVAAAPAPAAPAPAPAAAPAAAPPAPAASAKAAVFFDTGKAAVAAKGQEDLKALVASAGTGARFAVSGFHDAKGDPAKNAELAKQRAFAVRDALKSLGVAEDKIELRKPEATSAASGPEAEAAARRVEVSVL